MRALNAPFVRVSVKDLFIPAHTTVGTPSLGVFSGLVEEVTVGSSTGASKHTHSRRPSESGRLNTWSWTVRFVLFIPTAGVHSVVALVIVDSRWTLHFYLIRHLEPGTLYDSSLIIVRHKTGTVPSSPFGYRPHGSQIPASGTHLQPTNTVRAPSATVNVNRPYALYA